MLIAYYCSTGGLKIVQMRHMSSKFCQGSVTRFRATIAAGIVASLQSVAAQCMLRGCMHLHGLSARIVDDPNQSKASAYLFNFITALYISFEYLKGTAPHLHC
jgi:hypothetical protein